VDVMLLLITSFLGPNFAILGCIECCDFASDRQCFSLTMSGLNTHPDSGHQHTPDCGHTRIKHGSHVDYLHDGHLHYPVGASGSTLVEEHVLEISCRFQLNRRARRLESDFSFKS
jgi:hypothetical protein